MHIEILIPGLFAVPGRHLDDVRDAGTDRALDVLLRDAKAKPGRAGRHVALADWMHGNKPPIASLQWLAGTDKPLPANLALLTPVHLQAGMDDLVMMPPAMLELSTEESAELAGEISTFFGNDPRVHERNSHWFIELENDDIDTTPLHAVIGKSIRNALPKGDGARRANAWMNELQMLLHSSARNSRRVPAGKPSVNGGWIWGEGRLPGRSPANLEGGVFVGRGSGRDLALGLSEFSDGRYSEEFPRNIADRPVHVIDTRLSDCLDADDAGAWKMIRNDVVEQWLEPAIHLWKQGEVTSVNLHGGDARILEWRNRGLRSIVGRFFSGPISVPYAEEDAGGK